MFNKFFFVLALLITLSMGNMLEFKLEASEDCEFGTIQERMNKSLEKTKDIGKTFEDDDGEWKLKSLFVKRIARLAAKFIPSHEEVIDLVNEFNVIKNETLFKLVFNRQFVKARDYVWKNTNSNFEAYVKALFAYHYLNVLTTGVKATKCITTQDYIKLYIY